MALTSSGISSSIIQAGNDLKGPTWFPLTAILGIAISTWARSNPTNLAMNGSTNGVIGAGRVSGKIFVTPRPLVVPNAAILTRLLGPTTPAMTRAIGIGVSTAFSTSAQYTGTSAGVGAGVDISKITISNGSSLTAQIHSVASRYGFHGPTMPAIAVALGTGISSLLLGGTGVGAVVGGGGPLPSTGTSFSTVL